MEDLQAFRILHAADVHLGQSNIYTQDISRNHTFQAFSNLVTTAIEREVEVILLAGDFLEIACLDDDELDAISAQLKQLSEHNIKTFIIAGNHDPLYALSPYLKEELWPKHCYIVENNTYYLDKLNLSITGISFRTALQAESQWEKLVESYEKSKRKGHINESTLSIALLHGSLVDAHSSYNPLAKDKLINGPFHYIALGHVHQNTPYLEESNATVYAYPGPIQGTSFADSGPKGAYLLTFKGQDLVEHEYINLAEVLYEIVDISVHADEDIELKIKETLENYTRLDQTYALQLNLRGETRNMPDIEVIKRMYKGSFDSLEILSEELVEVQVNKWKKEKSILASTYNKMQERITQSSNEKTKRIEQKAAQIIIETFQAKEAQ